MKLLTSEEIDNQRAEFNREMRHRHAIEQSDWEFLRQSLRNAADRFDDLAQILEKDQHPQAGFARASAQRYRLAADLKG